MPQKLLVNNFEWIEDTSQFNENFIKDYNEENDKWYLLEVDVQYPEKLLELHHDLPFFSERMKIEKAENLVANLHNKTQYVIHIRNLKEALNHGLVLKKVHRVIKFNQKALLKPYIDMNTKLRQKVKNNFEKNLLKLINNAVFWKKKTIENMRKHRNIVTTEKKRNYLVSEPNYHTKKFFTEDLLAIEMRKTAILMNKSAYLGLSILNLTKTIIYEFWYDYAKPKYCENAKLCYMDTDSIIVHVKTDDIYTDNEEDVETRFDTSHFELDRPLPKGKIKK